MNVAFIPVRGGSKSIPLKNIKMIAGRPLVYWTIKAACESSFIDKVYVSTDSDEIKNTVEHIKVNNSIFDKVIIVGRSPSTASDTASTESAMLEFAEKYDFDNIVLIQATSPMLSSEDLDGGYELFKTEGTDSVLSVVRQYRFIWDKDCDGNVQPVNYDVYNRPRRQEFDGFLMENGAFYICRRSDLLRTKNRISGNIKAYEMREDTVFEIDEPSDWIIIEALMKKNGIKDNISSKKIKMFLTDCDGCLTDAGMYYTEFGDELKKFNTKDGMGLSKLRELGIITGIITGEDTEIVKRRAKKLGICEVHLGVKDKLSVVRELADKYNISMDEILYVGDDENDLEVLNNVGFPCTVADAIENVKERAVYISTRKGGDAAIRDIMEHFMNDSFYETKIVN